MPFTKEMMTHMTTMFCANVMGILFHLQAQLDCTYKQYESTRKLLMMYPCIQESLKRHLKLLSTYCTQIYRTRSSDKFDSLFPIYVYIYISYIYIYILICDSQKQVLCTTGSTRSTAAYYKILLTEKNLKKFKFFSV
jgi:hypothetical protein